MLARIINEIMKTKIKPFTLPAIIMDIILFTKQTVTQYDGHRTLINLF